jgi:hypothetical protein
MISKIESFGLWVLEREREREKERFGADFSSFVQLCPL